MITNAFQAYQALVQLQSDTKSGKQKILYLPQKAMDKAKSPKADTHQDRAWYTVIPHGQNMCI